MFRCSFKNGRTFYNSKTCSYVPFIEFAAASLVAAWCLGKSLSEIQIQRIETIELPKTNDANDIETGC